MALEEFYNEIATSIVELDENKAIELAKRSISEKYDLLKVIEKGFGEGIRRIGKLWEDGEFFLPELMLGGNIMQECMNLLLPHLRSEDEGYSPGTIVIATIEGDIHSIGKTIVATMLSANGFEVYDLGADISAEKIIEVAIEKNADVIGISALLTTTMIGQKKVIELLKERGIRDKFKVILGGAPVTDSWTKECEADGYAENAMSSIKLVKKLLSK
ncbi:MAG: B12-binding domain-containing protein [Candidatus Thorarchaeota archaeon]